MNTTQIETETETQTESSGGASSTSPNFDSAASAASTRRFNIPGDVARRATSALPADQRDAILWLHTYGYDHNLSCDELGAMLKQPDGSSYDKHTVWSVLTGRHGAKKDNFVKAILDFKRLVEARATITRSGFVATALAKKIFDLCEAALIYQKWALIFGPTQIGKTTALEEYARTHNHGQTTYLRMPEGGRYLDFISEFARVLRISPQNPNLKHRIIDSFDSQKLLIIDEAHQPFIKLGQTSHRPLEFIREIWDRTKCGVVLSATDLLDAQFQTGSAKGILDQISQRRLLTTRLPKKPTRADLNTFAKSYRLAPADGEALQLQSEIIRDSGLGRWLTILQAASRLAEKRKQPLSWEHAIKAHAAFLKLEDPNQD